MKRVSGLKWGSISFTGILLVIVFISNAAWLLLLPLLAIGILWLIAIFSQKQWLLNLSFFCSLAVLVLGFWLEIHLGWLVLSLAGILVAWDLQFFEWRLRAAEQVIAAETQVKKHGFKLGVVILLGIVTALLAQYGSIQFDFRVMAILSIIAVIALIQMVRMGRGLGD